MLVLELHGRVGARAFIETRALVVVAMRHEQAGASPDLDRRRLDVKAFGDLVLLEETSCTQSSVSIAKIILIANPGDDMRMKRFAGSRGHAAVVEQLRDLRVGMFVEESIDGVDDFG